MTQLSLLDRPIREAPYQPSSRTSREQARRVRPKAGTQRARVLAYLERIPQGATMHFIAEALQIPLSSVCARCNELRQAGLATDTDDERETPYGGRAAVWVAR